MGGPETDVAFGHALAALQRRNALMFLRVRALYSASFALMAVVVVSLRVSSADSWQRMLPEHAVYTVVAVGLALVPPSPRFLRLSWYAVPLLDVPVVILEVLAMTTGATTLWQGIYSGFSLGILALFVVGAQLSLRRDVVFATAGISVLVFGFIILRKTGLPLGWPSSLFVLGAIAAVAAFLPSQLISLTLARTREVEGLNAQLRIQVQARSRELVRALRKLGDLEDRDLAPGELFAGRVRVERRLGRGGMGVVYLGTDLVIDGPVALKLMRRVVGADRGSLERFLGEARASAAISHPSIVRSLHVDVAPDGRVYQIMEYVEGKTLAQRLEAGPLSTGAAARLLSVAADALAAAHEVGVIHRDIKPSNLILTATEPGVRVLDFGISKIQDPNLVAETPVGALMGTPQYMSPEQARGTDAVSAASDVYSLGVTLFEAIAGKALFLEPDIGAQIAAHISTPPPDVRERRPDVPPALAGRVAACLQKEPAARPRARDLSAALAAIADALAAPPAVAIAATRAMHEEALADTLEPDGKPGPR